MTETGFSVDFTDVSGEGQKSLPAGNYLARVFKLTWGETGENSKEGAGKPKLTVVYKIDGGTHDGRERYATYTFGGGLPLFKRFALATGKATEEQLNGKMSGKDLVRLVETFQGAQVAIKLTRMASEEYGEADGFQNRVKDVYHKNSDQAKKAKAAQADPLAP